MKPLGKAEHDPDEIENGEAPAKKPEPEPKPENPKEPGLEYTEQERRDFRDKKVSWEQLHATHKRKRTEGLAKLNDWAAKAEQTGDKDLLSDGEYKNFQKRIEAQKSGGKIDEIIDEMKALQDKKEAQKIDDGKELTPDHEKIKDQEKRFLATLRLNKHLVHSMQPYEEWFTKEMNKKPITVAKLKKLRKDFEGTESTDENGLYPRRQEYAKFQNYFSKYGVTVKPENHEFFKANTLKEKQHYSEHFGEMEDILTEQEKLGLVDNKTIRTEMQDVLTAKNINQQHDKIENAEAVQKAEKDFFINNAHKNLDKTVDSPGGPIRIMSESERDFSKQSYSETSYAERQQRLKMMPSFLKEAEEQVEKLKELFKEKGTPELLKLAIASFSKLSFEDRTKEINEHKKTLEQSESDEKAKEALLIKASHAAVDQAEQKGIICDKTKKRSKDFFNDPRNYEDKDHKGKPDLKKLEKLYDTLVSATPDEKGRNIAAYAKRQKLFKEDLRNAAAILSDEKIKEWQEKFDAEGWKGREKVSRDFQIELKNLKTEKAEQEKIEDEVGITQKEKNEAAENLPGLSATVNMLNEFAKEGTEKSIRMGIAMGALYLSQNIDAQDNEEFMTAYSALIMLKSHVGMASQAANTDKEIIEEAMEEVIEEADHKKALRDNLTSKRIVKEVETHQQHAGTTNATDRARQDTLDRTAGDTDKKEFMEFFYDQSAANDNEEYIVDENDEAQKATTFNIDKPEAMTDQKRQELEKTLKKETVDHNKNKGSRHIRVVNNQGDEGEMKTEGKTKQAAKTEKLEKHFLKDAMDKVKTIRQSKGVNEEGDKFADQATALATLRRKEQEEAAYLKQKAT